VNLTSMPLTPILSKSPSSLSPRNVASGPIPIALVSLFTFLVCYFRSFIFPNIPIIFWGDQVGFFYGGSRIVSGQLPYRDYFQFTPPGTDLTYALLIKCFGLRAWIPNLLMAFLAATMVWLITILSRKLMRGPVSLLPAVLFTGFILYGSLDPTHHWFSTVAVMAAMLVLFDGTSLTRIATAGALCGVAACFTQTKGATAVAGFVAYLIYKSWQNRGPANEAIGRKVNAKVNVRVGENVSDKVNNWAVQCLLLCLAAAVVFFAVNAYFIGAAGLKQWLYCMIAYPLKYYPAPSVNNWRVLLYDFQSRGGALRWICYPFVYATVPLVYIAFFFTLRWQPKKNESVPWDHLVLLTLTGLGMFLAIASSPSMKRMCTVSAPAIILLTWMLNTWRLDARIAKLRSPNRSAKSPVGPKIMFALAAIALVFAIEPTIHTQLRHNAYLNLPAGRVAFPDPAIYQEYSWVLEHTHPRQFFFGMPPFYTPFHLRNPSATVSIETTEYTRPEQVAELVQALESHPVPLLILNKSREFLRPAKSSADHADPFRAYVLKNYRLILSFPSGDDVWEKI
jgi:hypothetical protein